MQLSRPIFMIQGCRRLGDPRISALSDETWPKENKASRQVLVRSCCCQHDARSLDKGFPLLNFICSSLSLGQYTWDTFIMFKGKHQASHVTAYLAVGAKVM